VNASERLSLIFDWPSRHAVHLALPLMVVVSFFAHAAGLAVFQLKPPAEPAVPRRSAGVFVLAPWSEDAAKVTPMIAAADPALFSASASEDRDIWLLPSTDYPPSFDSLRPSLAPLPTEPPQVTSFTSSAPVSSERRSRPIPKAEPTLPTRIEWTGALRDFSFEPAPGVAFAAPARQNLLPLEFLVAVGPHGKLLHAFPLGSSGNERIDRDALRSLLGGHLSAGSRSLEAPVWGTAIFLWGADIQRLPTE
jgi:hypothetical protein